MFVGDIFDPFAKVKPHITVKSAKICIDNWIFLLHRKVSFLLAFIALVFIFSYPVMIDNEPIVCFGPHKKDVPEEFVDDWCWLAGTWIVPEHIDKPPGIEVVHSGVGPDDLVNGTTTRLYHYEYIFYPVTFLLQLITFAGIHKAWKAMEGGRLANLLSELTAAIVDQKTLNKRLKYVTDYMTSSDTFHNKYAHQYILCEVLNALNLVLQFWALDMFHHNEFFSYGWDAVTYISSLNAMNSTAAIVDPFTKLFPKLAHCEFTRFGASGNPVPHKALCVLPLNNIADKIFLVWWFWLVFLGFITIVGLIYRGLLLLSPCTRYFVLRLKVKSTGWNQDLADLKYSVDHGTYGDWFVLSLMHKNMDCWTFAALLKEVVVKMRQKKNKRL